MTDVLWITRWQIASLRKFINLEKKTEIEDEVVNHVEFYETYKEIYIFKRDDSGFKNY
jgi:hypothetical protein